MDRIDSIGRILEDLARTLDSPDLDPDPSRADWSTVDGRVAQARGLVNDRLFLDYATKLDEDEARGTPSGNIRDAAASTVGELVALLAVSRHGDDAKTLLDIAQRLAPKSGAVRDELDAARSHLDDYARLVRARWLLRAQRESEGDKLLRSMMKTVTEPRLKERARVTLDGPRSLNGSVPSLFRINGFGVGLYGSRDPWPDGSYVTTLCLSALFIPVFPLRSYRVKPDERGWVFFARHRLSRFARGVQAVVLGSALAGGAAMGYQSWAASPEHIASVAFDAAQTAERDHHDDQALRAYESLLQTSASRLSSGDLARASEGFARLALRGVHEPLAIADVDHAERVVRRFTSLPVDAKTPRAEGLFTAAVTRWMAQVGAASPAATQATLRLAELGARVAAPGYRAPFDEKRVEMERRIAARFGAAWPLEALPHLIAVGPSAVQETRSLVESVLASPSLALAGFDELRAWQRAVRDERDPALVALSRDVTDRLTRAGELAATPARRQALETGQRPALEAWAQAHPDDQEVVAALATQRRREGANAEALQTITAIGAPGRMTPGVRLAYADLLADTGRVADADEILSRTLETRLPRFQAAQRAWAEAIERVEQALVNTARSGGLPTDVQERMRDKAEAEQRQIFGEWMREMMRNAPELNEPRSAMERVSDVVPTALTLGMIKLRRANEFDGDERRRALGEAERLFLAIRDQAEGTPAFRLGLGQVYHRLGRAAEGDRELNALLSEGDAQQKLSVASVYRDLGVTERARTIVQGVYDASDGDAKGVAAMTMALLSDTLEDEEMWLRRAPATLPRVRIRLREVEARKLLRDGRLAEADRAFSEVAAEYGRDASHDGASANNAAIAEFARFGCTGDIGRVDAGVGLLEQARRHAPESSIVASNLADALLFRGGLRVLSGFARVSVVRPEPPELDGMLDALTSGAQREPTLTALRRDPSMQRGVELLRQAAVLSPERVELYARELDALSRVDDVAGMLGLQGRLQRVERLDTGALMARLRRWQDGLEDGQARQSATSAVARAAHAVTEVERTHDAPTLALALENHARALLNRARVNGSADDARAAADLRRRAASTWDGAADPRSLASALIESAVLSSVASDETLRRARDADWRMYPTDQTLLRLRQSGAEGAAAIARLRARPEVEEALTLLRAASAREPGSSDLILARAFADEALITAAQGAASRDVVRLSLAIEAIIRPTSAARERASAVR